MLRRTQQSYLSGNLSEACLEDHAAADSENGAAVYRNIDLGDTARYRLPQTGKVFILHRVGGALMFLLLPFVLHLFEQSLISETSLVELTAPLSNGSAKIVILTLTQVYPHHLCAGIRHLVLDLRIGIDKTLASKSAMSVSTASLLLTAALGARLFGLS